MVSLSSRLALTVLCVSVGTFLLEAIVYSEYLFPSSAHDDYVASKNNGWSVQPLSNERYLYKGEEDEEENEADELNKDSKQSARVYIQPEGVADAAEVEEEQQVGSEDDKGREIAEDTGLMDDDSENGAPQEAKQKPRPELTPVELLKQHVQQLRYRYDHAEVNATADNNHNSQQHQHQHINPAATKERLHLTRVKRGSSVVRVNRRDSDATSGGEQMDQDVGYNERPDLSGYHVDTVRGPVFNFATQNSANRKAQDIKWEYLPASTKREKEKRVIYFLHLHKAGGTTLCDAAKANGMITSPANCNVQYDQRCCGYGDTLYDQQRFARDTKFTFVANEGDMYREMDVEHYRYVTILRDSQSRYRSHWKHTIRAQKGAVQSFSSWWQLQPDNWTTRKICGTACIHVPKFRITRRLFEMTVDRLGKFEDIMILEEFNSTYTQFAHHVGWEKLPVPLLEKKSKYESAISFRNAEEAQWGPLMSVLDDTLMEIARQRSRGVVKPVLTDERVAALSAYFEEGPRLDCKNPCCGMCSAY
jgi:hypothetical protein